MTSPPLLWNVKRVAQELSLAEATVYRMVGDKRIPYIRVGRALRFSPAELQAWLQKRQIEEVR